MAKKIAKNIVRYLYLAAPLLFLPIIPGCPLLPG